MVLLRRVVVGGCYPIDSAGATPAAMTGARSRGRELVRIERCCSQHDIIQVEEHEEQCEWRKRRVESMILYLHHRYVGVLYCILPVVPIDHFFLWVSLPPYYRFLLTTYLTALARTVPKPLEQY